MFNPGYLLKERYRIDHFVGKGGTSYVYCAIDIYSGLKVAIKEIYQNSVVTAVSYVGGLMAEESILKRLKHPGLPQIYEAFSYNSGWIIVMEFIEGHTLSHELTQKGCLAEKDVIHYAIQICDVLEYLHSRTPPVIYRDMKPSNVMIRPDGKITLIDFGIAREYKIGSMYDTMAFGTYGYAAPEQISRDMQSDARTDIYSLGITLYVLLTGCDPDEPYKRKLDAVNGNISPVLVNIVEKCIRTRAEERYQNILQLKSELQSLKNNFSYFDDFERYIQEKDYNVYNNHGLHVNDREIELNNAVVDQNQFQTPNKSNAGIIGAVVGGLVVLVAVIAVVAVALGGNSNIPDYPVINPEIEIEDEYEYEDEDDVFVYEEYDFYGNLVSFDENGDGYVYAEDVVEINISKPQQRYFVIFEAPESGYYNFMSYSEDNVIPSAWLMNEDFEYIASWNTYADYEDFEGQVYLRKNELCYLETTLYYEDFDVDGIPVSKTGIYDIYITKE